ncbi:hypothetical protein EBZ37_14920, partial [bacterium]|nr:hypothetical protein [bacterium]
MNCVDRFLLQVAEHPDRCAIWVPRGPSVTFRELSEYSGRLQKQFSDSGLNQGDPVLVFLGLGIDLYAVAIALLSMGCPILLIEPWMPASRVERALEVVKPKAFIAGTIGKVWGLRTHAIRRIPRWISPERSGDAHALLIASVDPEHPGILAFTSGTTGEPKGAVRTHGYLLEQHSVFER